MLSKEIDYKEMDRIIGDVKVNIQKLLETSGGIQCVDRNCERIMAALKMLELNISDVQEFLD